MGEYVRQLVRDKQRWCRPMTPEEIDLGFRGWHSRNYLPHFDAPGLRQMITYRLADSMPGSLQREWLALLALQDEKLKRIKVEEYLDAGHGECSLRHPRIAALVEENLLHFDGKRYQLLGWVIMPNHVHVLIEIWQVPLSRIVQSWKSYTSKVCNQFLGGGGRFWAPDYFDRYIRSEEHYLRALRYIENNPVKACLVKEAKSWVWSSARHRKEGQERGQPVRQ